MKPATASCALCPWKATGTTLAAVEAAFYSHYADEHEHPRKEASHR